MRAPGSRQTTSPPGIAAGAHAGPVQQRPQISRRNRQRLAHQIRLRAVNHTQRKRPPRPLRQPPQARELVAAASVSAAAGRGGSSPSPALHPAGTVASTARPCWRKPPVDLGYHGRRSLHPAAARYASAAPRWPADSASSGRPAIHRAASGSGARLHLRHKYMAKKQCYSLLRDRLLGRPSPSKTGATVNSRCLCGQAKFSK